MSDIALPYREDADYVELTAKASQTAIARGEFVKFGSGGDSAVIVVCGADESGNVVGVAADDEREDRVVVYVGRKIIKMPGETSHTLAAGDAVYIGSATEVNGEPEAGASAKSIGVVYETDGDGVAFWPLWYQNRTQPDATS